MPTVKSKGLKSNKQGAVECESSDDTHCVAAAAFNTNEEEMKCCTPRGCKLSSEGIPCHVGDAVKVVCNNEQCNKSGWMHTKCFEEWEEHVLLYLKSCGRARSWSDKQRMQNLWTKKGYDLAYKACDCLCGKGHLRKDLDYIPPAKDDQEEAKKSKNHKKQDKCLPSITTKSQPIPVSIPSSSSNSSNGSVRPRVQILPSPSVASGGGRNRTTSISSTGSSPPASLSPVGCSPTDSTGRQFHHHYHSDRHHSGGGDQLRFEFPLTLEQAAAGNIFYHRPDLGAFKKLPAHKRNPYHIKMEDEGPYGNDETRCFVLASLSTRRITTIPCVVCGQDLKIFDRYPLCDGTLFLTPQRYISDISLTASSGNGVSPTNQYMNAVCMLCAEGLYTELHCKQCHRPWNGSALQVGTMYSYDVFAASPCCLRRLLCKNCGRVAVPSGQKLPFYSQFSRTYTCCNCGATGYHFVKPLNEIFYIQRV